MYSPVIVRCGFAIDRDGNKVPLSCEQRANMDRGLEQSFRQTNEANRPNPPNPGNGAREAIIAWFDRRAPMPRSIEDTVDSLLAHLWTEGFKVVPLESKDAPR
jgi:hypothetical protein